MQGIDQHIVRAVPRGRPERQIGQISEIANAPGSLGPDAVELGGQAPAAAAPQLLRQPQPVRRHDNRGAGLKVAGTQVEAVVAERQVTRQHEARLADPAPVEVERRREVVDLTHAAAGAAVLELQPHFGWITVGDVHPEPRRRARAPHNRRRQPTCPITSKMCGQGRVALLFVACGNAEGGEHRDQRGLRDEHVPAGPVRVPGGDAEALGEVDQRGRELSHVAHLACRARIGPPGAAIV